MIHIPDLFYPPLPIISTLSKLTKTIKVCTQFHLTSSAFCPHIWIRLTSFSRICTYFPAISLSKAASESFDLYASVNSLYVSPSIQNFIGFMIIGFSNC